VNPPAPITTSTRSGIHSRLRTPKIANPLRLFPRPAPCQPLDHATTHPPRLATRRPLSGKRLRLAATSPQNVGASMGRNPTSTSKPCRWPPYRLVPNVIWDRNAFRVRRRTVRISAPTRKSCHGRYPRAALQCTFQRARTDEKRLRAAAVVEAQPMSYASVTEVALQDPSASPLTRPLEVTTAHATQGKEPGSEPHSRPSTGDTANGTAVGSRDHACPACGGNTAGCQAAGRGRRHAGTPADMGSRSPRKVRG
jgi:hypothetical protein